MDLRDVLYQWTKSVQSRFDLITSRFHPKICIYKLKQMIKSVKRTSTGVDGRWLSTRTSTSRKAQSGRRRPWKPHSGQRWPWKPQSGQHRQWKPQSGQRRPWKPQSSRHRPVENLSLVDVDHENLSLTWSTSTTELFMVNVRLTISSRPDMGPFPIKLIWMSLMFSSYPKEAEQLLNGW